MTQNQIRVLEAQEQHRANVAREQETNRSNVQTELLSLLKTFLEDEGRVQQRETSALVEAGKQISSIGGSLGGFPLSLVTSPIGALISTLAAGGTTGWRTGYDNRTTATGQNLVEALLETYSKNK